MKREIIIFALMLMMLNVSFFAFAEDDVDDNKEYDKTLAIGFNPVGYILFGPSAGLEYTGFGPIGISAYYQQIGSGFLIKALANTIDAKISGYGILPQLKYYYDYDNRAHDSGYVSLTFSIVSMKFQSTIYDSYLKINQKIPWISWGRRWQWSPFFIDFNAGVGFSFATVDASDNFNKSDRDTVEAAVQGAQFGGNLIMGVAF